LLTQEIQLRTDNDDLVVYKPVFIPSETESGQPNLQFFREAHHTLSKLTSKESLTETEIPTRRRPLRALQNVSGLSTVFMPGDSGRFIVKTAKSTPHVVRLRGEFTRWLSGFSSPLTGCENGFIYVDAEVRAAF
jgi:cleavage and polyadenylation specificity factor subunit 1